MRDGVITEADTCREFVTPRLVEAGWGAAPHAIGEQRSFTNGRIIVAGGKVRRSKQKRADYLLYYRRDYPLALVEGKEIGLPAQTGVQQAREYAEILGQGRHPPRKDQEWRGLAAEAYLTATGRHRRFGSPVDRVDDQGCVARP